MEKITERKVEHFHGEFVIKKRVCIPSKLWFKSYKWICEFF